MFSFLCYEKAGNILNITQNKRSQNILHQYWQKKKLFEKQLYIPDNGVYLHVLALRIECSCFVGEETREVGCQCECRIWRDRQLQTLCGV